MNGKWVWLTFETNYEEQPSFKIPVLHTGQNLPEKAVKPAPKNEEKPGEPPAETEEGGPVTVTWLLVVVLGVLAAAVLVLRPRSAGGEGAKS
ncbi:MAG: hypothetical protein ACYTAF_17245 [Planctomycetota bacterium]